MTPGYITDPNMSGLYVGKSDAGALKGLIDEIRIFDMALGHNNINGSGGNGNPAENFPSSVAEYLRGQWSFFEISSGDVLADFSAGTEAAISLGSIGATAGNIVDLDLVAAYYVDVAPGDRESIRTNEIQYKAAISAGDDEFSLVLT